METGRPEDEVAEPLVYVEDLNGLPPRGKSNRTRDVHVLSLAFLFVFSAYGAAQNLESTVNTKQDLGTTSLGILYLTFTVFSLFGKPMVRALGVKTALVAGTSGYWLFIASNLKPLWYTMVPASFYLGITASLIWVGQGVYLTSTARGHARDTQLHEGTVIGDFNGEFWGAFASTQVVGNLVSLFLLSGGKDGESSTKTTLLFIVFLVCVTVGTILMCFLSKHDDKELADTESSENQSSVLHLLKSVIAPLFDGRMLLIIPLLIYSGLQQSYVWAEFTKHVLTPTLGVSGVGGAMAVYGAFDVICSLVAGRVTSGLSSITLIVTGGALLQLAVFLWLLLEYSLIAGLQSSVIPLVMAAMLGMGDGVFNTQICSLLGMLFRDDTEAAFAQLKVWQSAATAVVFFLSPCITFQVMSIAMVVGLCIAMACFLYLTLHVEKVSTVQS